MMTAVFQSIGPYEVLEEIGRGGMAAVFLATDTRTNRRVALKLVPTGNDREAQEILEAERWGAKLQEQFCRASGHVPAVYEYGTEWGYFYIAMEYLEGLNLSEVIARGPLSSQRAAGIAVQLCEFLEAAHGFAVTIDGRPLRSLPNGIRARRRQCRRHWSVGSMYDVRAHVRGPPREQEPGQIHGAPLTRGRRNPTIALSHPFELPDSIFNAFTSPPRDFARRRTTEHRHTWISLN